MTAPNRPHGVAVTIDSERARRYPTAIGWEVDADGNLLIYGEGQLLLATWARHAWDGVERLAEPRAGDVIPQLATSSGEPVHR